MVDSDDEILSGEDRSHARPKTPPNWKIVNRFICHGQRSIFHSSLLWKIGLHHGILAVLIALDDLKSSKRVIISMPYEYIH